MGNQAGADFRIPLAMALEAVLCVHVYVCVCVCVCQGTIPFLLVQQIYFRPLLQTMSVCMCVCVCVCAVTTRLASCGFSMGKSTTLGHFPASPNAVVTGHRPRTAHAVRLLLQGQPRP